MIASVKKQASKTIAQEIDEMFPEEKTATKSPKQAWADMESSEEEDEPKRGNPKVPRSLGNRAKTLLLVESCRSVPPTSRGPRADREGHLTGTRPEARDLHFRATPSRLVRVDGSRKLPQIMK